MPKDDIGWLYYENARRRRWVEQLRDDADRLYRRVLAELDREREGIQARCPHEGAANDDACRFCGKEM